MSFCSNAFTQVPRTRAHTHTERTHQKAQNTKFQLLEEYNENFIWNFMLTTRMATAASTKTHQP